MTIKPKITYLFDPLCGWCYGASPTLQKLEKDTRWDFELAPTGLFAHGGRLMDAAFAEFAWSNDQRISKLTGQRFPEAYRQKVLGNHGSRFDSSAATLALTAVRLSEPSREFEVLSGLQEARYLSGINTCDALSVEKLLRGWGLENAAGQFAANDVNLIASNAKRIKDAGSLLQSHGAQGVPTLVIKDHLGERLVAGNALYNGIDALLNDVAQS